MLNLSVRIGFCGSHGVQEPDNLRRKKNEKKDNEANKTVVCGSLIAIIIV